MKLERQLKLNKILGNSDQMLHHCMRRSIHRVAMSNLNDTILQPSLSPRDRQVIVHVLSGHPNKVIAQDLGVTEAAAKVQLESLLRKINVDNRTQATIWVLKNLPDALAAL